MQDAVHVCRGWERVCARPAEAERARGWLVQHPSAMPAVDALWAAALEGSGALAAWLEQGEDPDAWPLRAPAALRAGLPPLRLPQPMVEPGQVEPILSDAARLVGEGSAALALWLRDPPGGGHRALEAR